MSHWHVLSSISILKVTLCISMSSLLSLSEGDMRYWHKAEAPKAKQGSWRSPHPTKAVDTEMTSYVLLTYARKADIVGGKGIMQWVAQQRNPNGGFTSTQVKSLGSPTGDSLRHR